ncbi:hypothetical protein Tco_0364970 [Tanacetum coccineum]
MSLMKSMGASAVVNVPTTTISTTHHTTHAFPLMSLPLHLPKLTTTVGVSRRTSISVRTSVAAVDSSAAVEKDKTTVLQPHSSEVGFINHMLILKLSKAQVDQGSQIKMIQVKEMMQDNDLKNLKSKDKGSKSRSQSMDEQSHYKQDKTITRQSINVKRHIFNVIGDTEKFEERDLNIGGDC